MTGAQLKDALEHAASFFPAWPVPPGQNLWLPGYNADSAEGASNVIDLTQPVGQRIRDLGIPRRTALSGAQTVCWPSIIIAIPEAEVTPSIKDCPSCISRTREYSSYSSTIWSAQKLFSCRRQQLGNRASRDVGGDRKSCRRGD